MRVSLWAAQMNLSLLKVSLSAAQTDFSMEESMIDIFFLAVTACVDSSRLIK